MKDGIRILGVDDSSFSFEDDEALITGVVYRGTEFIEEIVTSKVTVDGHDSTEKLIELFEKCSNHGQIKAILVDGLSFAGLNPVDIRQVAEETGKPVIAVTTNRPDRDKFKKALKNNGKKVEHLSGLDNYSEVELEDGLVFFQFKGITESKAGRIIEKSIIHGRVPEPVRVAHMIGAAVE